MSDLKHYKAREQQLMRECDRRDRWLDEMGDVLCEIWDAYPQLAQFTDRMKTKLANGVHTTLANGWTEWDEMVRKIVLQIGGAIDDLRERCEPMRCSVQHDEPRTAGRSFAIENMLMLGARMKRADAKDRREELFVQMLRMAEDAGIRRTILRLAGDGESVALNGEEVKTAESAAE